MDKSVSPELAGALVAAQGIAVTPESAAECAKFATLVLTNSAKAFATLAFEQEPSGYAEAQRRHAP